MLGRSRHDLRGKCVPLRAVFPQRPETLEELVGDWIVPCGRNR
jgi:hypothetical protein